MALEQQPHADIAPQPGTDFYYATLYLPPPVRHEVHVLEACRREIVRIPQTCSDRGVAHVKLAWWRDEFERLGSASPRHEITRGLAAFSAANPDLVDIYTRLVERVDASLSAPALVSREAVMDTIRDLYGDIFRQIVLRGGTYDLDTITRLVDFACRIELAYELTNLRQHRHGGLLFLSQDAITRHRLSVDGVRQAAHSADIRDLLVDEFTDLAAALQSAWSGLPRSLRRQQRLLCTLGCIVQRVVQLTLDDDCNVLEQRIELTPVHKLWIAWRTRAFG